MENTYIIEGIVLHILKSQLFLLPFVVLALLFAKKKLSLTFQWRLHRGIIAALVITPLLFLLPVEKSVTDFSKNVVNLDIPKPDFVYNLNSYMLDFNNPQQFLEDSKQQSSTEEKQQSLPGEKQQSLGEKGFQLPVFSIFGLISLVICLASLLGGIRFLYRWACQAVFLREAVRFARKRLVIRKIEIIYSAQITTPFSAGLIKKRIYLPIGYLDNKKHLKTVIKHEMIHIKAGHIYWTFAEKLLTALFWYNPYIHLLHNHGEDLREFLCDKAVSEKITPIEYGKALLAGAEEQISSGTLFYLSTGWRKKHSMKQRLNKLFDKTNKKSPFTGILLTGSIILTFLILFGIASCATSSPEREAAPTAVSDENTTTITLTTWSYYYPIRMAAGWYEKEHPNVKIEIREINDGNELLSPEFVEHYMTNLEKEFENGTAPDIIWGAPFTTWQYKDEGYLADLEEYMKNDPDFTEKNYYMNVFDAYSFNGATYMLPLNLTASIRPFQVVDEVHEKSGVILESNIFGWETLAEINEQLAALDDPSIRFFDLNSTYFGGLTIFSQFEDYIGETNGNITFDSDLFLKRLTFYKQYTASSNFILGTEDGDYEFLTDNNITSTNDWELTEEAFGFLEHKRDILNWNDSGNGSFEAFDVFAINNRSHDKEIAWDFLKFMLSPRVQALSTFGLSVNKEGLRNRKDIMMNESSADSIMKRMNKIKNQFHNHLKVIPGYPWQQYLLFDAGKQSAEETAENVKRYIENGYKHG